MSTAMSTPKDKAVDDDDDDYDKIPLQHQRPFGSGLHRKPIAFVSASGGGQLKSVDDSAAGRPQQNVADIYLNLVLSEDATRSKSAPPTSNTTTTNDERPPPPQTETCPVCKLPLQTETGTHAQSFAHQVCLPHSQPPSALDRTRMGLTYLSTHGWDPDARRGLGAAQQGIQFPVKAKVKDDKLGIGIPVPKAGSLPLPPPKKKTQLLDAKKVRKMALEERKRAAEIRRELFGDGKLEKYLGSGAGAGAAG